MLVVGLIDTDRMQSVIKDFFPNIAILVIWKPCDREIPRDFAFHLSVIRGGM